MKSVLPTSEQRTSQSIPVGCPDSLHEWFPVEQLVEMSLQTALPSGLEKDREHMVAQFSRNSNLPKSLLGRMNQGGEKLIPAIMIYSYASGYYSSREIAENAVKDHGIETFLSWGLIQELDLRNFRRGYRDILTSKLYELLVLASERHIRDLRFAQNGWKSELQREDHNMLAEIAVDRVQKGLLIDHIYLDD